MELSQRQNRVWSGGKQEAAALGEREIVLVGHAGNGAGVRFWKDLSDNVR